MIARVAVREPMPTDDRDWLVDATSDVPGVHAVYHLLDPETGNGLSVAVFADDAAAHQAGAAIRRRAEEIGRHDSQRPARVSETFYQVLRGRPWTRIALMCSLGVPAGSAWRYPLPRP